MHWSSMCTERPDRSQWRSASVCRLNLGRRSLRDYLHFVSIAIGSASEARYLVQLAVRLQYADAQDGKRLISGYTRVIRALQALITNLEARGPRPEARGPRPRGPEARGPRPEA